MSKLKEEVVRIPAVLTDNKNNKTYERGAFLGKVLLLYIHVHISMYFPM